jgi:hypothetical protein
MPVTFLTTVDNSLKLKSDGSRIESVQAGKCRSHAKGII